MDKSGFDNESLNAIAPRDKKDYVTKNSSFVFLILEPKLYNSIGSCGSCNRTALAFNQLVIA